MRRYQLCKERVEGIMAEIKSTKIQNRCGLLDRLQTVRVIKRWFKDLNKSDREKAVKLVNRYGLGRQVQALTDCILIQVYALDCIEDEYTKMNQFKALGERIINSMIQSFMMCITEADIRALTLNGGMDTKYPKIQRSKTTKYQETSSSETPKVVVKNPIGMEWNGIACVHDSIRNNGKTTEVLLEITDRGPKIVSYKNK